MKMQPGVMRPHPIPRFCGRHNSRHSYHGGGSAEETRECDTTWIHRIIVGRCQTVLAGRSERTAGCGRYPFLSEWCSTILAHERAGDCPQGYWRVILRYNESSFSALLSPKIRSPVVNIVERIKITEAVAHLRLPTRPTHTLSRNNKLVVPLWFISSAKRRVLVTWQRLGVYSTKESKRQPSSRGRGRNQGYERRYIRQWRSRVFVGKWWHRVSLVGLNGENYPLRSHRGAELRSYRHPPGSGVVEH